MKRHISIIIIFTVLGAYVGFFPVKSAGQPALTIQVDMSKTYQSIDGLGFYGPKHGWWESKDPSYFYSDAWLENAISDLGITIWRSDIQANNPIDSNLATNVQDTYWAVQKETVKAMKEKADARGVPLKIILTVWSPPGEFKINATDLGGIPNVWATRGGAHNDSRNGGTLNPKKYKDYANWLISGLQMYRKIGVEVYALSLQNEPLYVEFYNSCIYTSQWYVDMINNVVPIVKASFPNVKIFGSENMLEGEANNPDTYYTGSILSDPAAKKNVDIFAFHGYSNGSDITAISKHKTLWEDAYKNFSEKSMKPLWMTETGGYASNWLANGGSAAALDLGIAIGSSLKYGKASAWVLWSGSAEGLNGPEAGKKYFVSKQFYKFIRPGAVMVDAACTESNILSTAFYNSASNTFTSVLINSSATDRVVTLAGKNLPTNFTTYMTTGDPAVNCKEMGLVNNGAISLPANSIVTLVSQTVLDFASPKPTATLVPELGPSSTPFPIPLPNTPTVNVLTNSSDEISGKSINGGLVNLTIGTKKVSAEVFTGLWDYYLNVALKSGTKVTVTFKLFNGFSSKTKTLYVLPATPYVKTIKVNATYIKGTATKGSKVYAKIGSKYYSAYANSKTGVYSIKTPKIKKSTLVSVYCKAGGQMSGIRKMKAV